MRDELTRERESNVQGGSPREYLARHLVKLLMMSPDAAGDECPLDQERMILGRGPGVDVAFNDPDMSRQHASVEFTEDGPVVRDLGSTNGLFVNGDVVQSADLRNGDRIQLGGQTFQIVIEERQQTPEVYELTLDD